MPTAREYAEEILRTGDTSVDSNVNWRLVARAGVWAALAISDRWMGNRTHHTHVQEPQPHQSWEERDSGTRDHTPLAPVVTARMTLTGAKALARVDEAGKWDDLPKAHKLHYRMMARSCLQDSLGWDATDLVEGLEG